MPPQSRAQRRRQSQRAAPRRGVPAKQSAPVEAAPALEPAEGATVLLEAPHIELQRAAPRSARASTRRPVARVLAPVDYSEDYAMARRDLVRIAIIGVLLLAAMIGLGYAGVF